MSLLTNLFNLKSLNINPKSGLYHYTRETDFEKSRVHLRIDADGHGTLIVNANSVTRLNPTATFMAWLTLEGKTKEESIRALRSQYSVSKRQADSDLSSFLYQFDELLRPDGACPVHELELESLMPFSARPTAPYRMDLAITYRCNVTTTVPTATMPANGTSLNSARSSGLRSLINFGN